MSAYRSEIQQRDQLIFELRQRLQKKQRSKQTITKLQDQLRKHQDDLAQVEDLLHKSEQERIDLRNKYMAVGEKVQSLIRDEDKAVSDAVSVYRQKARQYKSALRAKEREFAIFVSDQEVAARQREDVVPKLRKEQDEIVAKLKKEHEETLAQRLQALEQKCFSESREVLSRYETEAKKKIQDLEQRRVQDQQHSTQLMTHVEELNAKLKQANAELVEEQHRVVQLEHELYKVQHAASQAQAEEQPAQIARIVAMERELAVLQTKLEQQVTRNDDLTQAGREGKVATQKLQKENEGLQIRLTKFTGEMALAKSVNDQYAQQVRQLQQQISEMEMKSAELQLQLDTCKQKHKAKLLEDRSRVLATHQRADDLVQKQMSDRLSDLQERLHRAETQNEDYAKEITQLSGKDGQAQSRIQELLAQVDKSNAELVQHRHAAATAQKSLAAETSRAQSLTEALSQVRQQMVGLSGDAARARQLDASMATAESHELALQSKLQRIQEKLEQQLARNAELQQQLRDGEVTEQRLTKELEHAHNKVAEMTNDLATAHSATEQANHQVRTVTQQLGELELRKQRTKAKLKDERTRNAKALQRTEDNLQRQVAERVGELQEKLHHAEVQNEDLRQEVSMLISKDEQARSRIQELSAHVDTLSVDLVQQKNIAIAAEKNLAVEETRTNSLTDQMADLRQQIISLSGEAARVRQLQSSMASVENKEMSLQSKLMHIQEKLDHQLLKNSELQQQVRDEHLTAQKFEKEADAAQSRVTDTLTELATARNVNEQAQHQIQGLTEQLSTMEARRVRARNKLRDERSHSAKLVEQAQRDKAALTRDVQRLNQEHAELVSEIARVKQRASQEEGERNRDVQSEARVWQERMQAAQEKIAALERKATSLETSDKRLVEVESMYNMLKQSYSDAERRLAATQELRETPGASMREVGQLTEANSELSSLVATLQQQYQAAQQQLQQAQQQIQAMQEKSQQAMQSSQVQSHQQLQSAQQQSQQQIQAMQDKYQQQLQAAQVQAQQQLQVAQQQATTLQEKLTAALERNSQLERRNGTLEQSDKRLIEIEALYSASRTAKDELERELTVARNQTREVQMRYDALHDQQLNMSRIHGDMQGEISAYKNKEAMQRQRTDQDDSDRMREVQAEARLWQERLSSEKEKVAAMERKIITLESAERRLIETDSQFHAMKTTNSDLERRLAAAESAAKEISSLQREITRLNQMNTELAHKNALLLQRAEQEESDRERDIHSESRIWQERINAAQEKAQTLERKNIALEASEKRLAEAESQLQSLRTSYESQLQTVRTSHAELKQVNQTMEQERQALQRDVIRLTEQIGELNSQISVFKEREGQDDNSRVREVQSQLQLCQDRLAAAVEKNSQLERRMGALEITEKRAIELDAQFSVVKVTKDDLERELATARAQARELQVRFDSLQDQQLTMSRARGDMQEELATYRIKDESLESQRVMQLQSEVTTLRAQMKTLQDQKFDAEHKLATAAPEARKATQLQAELDALQRTSMDTRTQLAQSSIEKQELYQQVQTLTRQVLAATEQRTDLRGELEKSRYKELAATATDTATAAELQGELRAVQAEKRSLESQLADLQSRTQHAETNMQAQVVSLQAELRAIRDDADRGRGRNDTMYTDLSQARQALADLERLKGQTDNELASCRADLLRAQQAITEREARLTVTQSTIAELQRTVDLLKRGDNERLTTMQADLMLAASSKEDLQRTLMTAQEQGAQYQRENAALRAQLEQAGLKVDDVETRVKAARIESEQASLAKEQQRRDLESLRAQFEQKVREAATLQNEKDDYATRLQQSMRENDTYKQQHDRLAQSARAAESELAEARRAATQQVMEASHLASTEVSAAADQLAALKRENETLRTEVLLVKQMKGQSDVTEGAMKSHVQNLLDQMSSLREEYTDQQMRLRQTQVGALNFRKQVKMLVDRARRDVHDQRQAARNEMEQSVDSMKIWLVQSIQEFGLSFHSLLTAVAGNEGGSQLEYQQKMEEEQLLLRHEAMVAMREGQHRVKQQVHQGIEAAKKDMTVELLALRQAQEELATELQSARDRAAEAEETARRHATQIAVLKVDLARARGDVEYTNTERQTQESEVRSLHANITQHYEMARQTVTNVMDATRAIVKVPLDIQAALLSSNADDVAAAMKRLRKLLQAYATTNAKSIIDLKRELKESQAKELRLKAEADQCRSDAQRLEITVTDRDLEFSTLRRELADAKTAVRTSQRALEDAQEDIKRLNERLRSADAQWKEAQTHAQNRAMEYVQMQAEVHACKREITDRDASLLEKDSRLRQLQEQLGAQKKQFDEMHVQLEEYQRRELDALTDVSAIHSNQARLTELQDERDELLRRVNKLEQTVRDSQSELARRDRKLQEQSQQIMRHDEELAAVRRQQPIEFAKWQQESLLNQQAHDQKVAALNRELDMIRQELLTSKAADQERIVDSTVSVQNLQRLQTEVRSLQQQYRNTTIEHQDQLARELTHRERLERKLTDTERQLMDYDRRLALERENNLGLESKLGLLQSEAQSMNTQAHTMRAQLQQSQDELRRLRAEAQTNADQMNRSAELTRMLEGGLRDLDLSTSMENQIEGLAAQLQRPRGLRSRRS
eukprot:TRINITY_DN3522_c0_g1_i2.p1 TRINITY_DN3522_c0_g1~~TRINITY_DN3522_c0_g1_i2.p1  ORF type:complete len:2622 (+),score=920.63 TRINITY_DN3522_c0_g1_i2:73-7938(+)